MVPTLANTGRSAVFGNDLASLFLRYPQLRQPLHNPYRLQTHTNHLPDKPHDILRIISTVRIVHNPAAFVGLDPVLVNNPLQRRPIPTVATHRRGSVVKSQETVVTQLLEASDLLHCFVLCSSSPREVAQDGR